MEDVPRIKSRKERIKELLTGTKSKTGPARPIHYLTIATVVCLIGATIPYMATYRFFGQSSLFCLILLTYTLYKFRNQLPIKQVKQSLAIIGAVMLLTGSSSFFVPDFSGIKPPTESLYEPDREYKPGITEGFGLFGFGLQDTTIETAMSNGNITKAYTSETNISFSWIAVVKVRVFGE